MRLVEFKNGKYGIRVGSWLNGYEFKDLVSTKYNWKIGSKFFDDCMGSLEDCYRVTDKLKYKVLHKL